MADEKDNDQVIDPQDLSLVDDNLEDESKDDAALWQEFDQAETGAAEDDPTAATGDDDGKDPDSSAAEGDNDNQSDGNQPSDKQGQQPDPWATASPEQLAAYQAAQEKLQKLEQADRSNRGRLSAMQRQINDLTQKPAASKAADKQGQEGDENADGFLSSDDWTSFKDEYPEVAGPLGKLIGTQQSQITRLEKELSAIGSERRQDVANEQITLLNEAHPDWQDVAQDPAYVEWLDVQPPGIRALHESDFADDAIMLLDLFKTAQGGGNAQQQNRASANAGGRKPNNQPLSGKRARQLESASAARSRGPGAASGISEDGDPETIWKQFDEMERRRA